VSSPAEQLKVIEDGDDVVGGDLAEPGAGCRPTGQKRPDGPEVDVEGGCRACRLRASPSSRCPSHARMSSVNPAGRAAVRRSIQCRIAGVVSSVSRSSSARISATRGVDVVRAVRDRIWLVVTCCPGNQSVSTAASPSIVQLIVEGDHPFV